MKQAYIRSLEMIYLSEVKLTKKQYTRLAKEYNLLSIQSLQYIAQSSFQLIIRKVYLGIY